MAFSKTIQLYIFDGNPNGRIMCELSNWNGRVYKIARNEIAAFSRRADSDHTGVYFLLGKTKKIGTRFTSAKPKRSPQDCSSICENEKQATGMTAFVS